MYSVLDYGNMALDGVRMDAYARALARAVRPGDVVVDLGCGTGIFSLLAARAGAARVHAVDLNPAIWLLPEIAAENGLADRITIHPRSSLDVELAEKADVVVSDMRGVVPLCDDHTNAVRDARERFLKPGGKLLPERDRLFVAMVESRTLQATLAPAWESFERFGFSAKAAAKSVHHTPLSTRGAALQASDVLTDAGAWATVDYATYDGAALEGTVELTCVRGGIAHGLAVWFEATVFEDIRYASAPGWSLAYGRYFLPLLEPVRCDAGARARLTLRADARGDRWGWDTEIRAAGGEELARFRQATFLGAPTSPEALLRSSPHTAPSLSGEGELVRRVLTAMDGSRTIERIVEELGASLPEGRRRALAERVRELAARYAR